MTTTLYIDVNTAKLSRTNGGTPVTILHFFLRDLLSIQLAFVQNGTLVTSTVLAGSAVLKLGLKTSAGATTLMALANTYTLASQFAAVALSLNTEQLLAFFNALESDSITSGFIFEVEVTSLDGTSRQTFLQLPVTVSREVNTDFQIAPYIAVTAPTDGDLLSYQSSTASWRNILQKLVTDGGNF